MKKKIFIAALAICLVVISIAGSSLAYFTDTKQYTNVFTAGKGVELKILVNGSEYEESNLAPPSVAAYPGQQTAQKVELQSTGSSAYVGAIITFTKKDAITDLNAIINKDGSDQGGHKTVAVENLIRNLDKTNNDVRVSADGLTVYVIKKAVVSDTTKIQVLDGVSVPADWDNKEIAKFSGASMSVVGYAVQSVGFNDAITALQAGFDVFDNLPAASN